MGADGQWLLSVYRIGPSEWRYAPTLPLPFVGDGRWQVRRIDPIMAGARADQWRDGWQSDGAWLRLSGLPLPPMQAESAAIFLIEAL